MFPCESPPTTSLWLQKDPLLLATCDPPSASTSNSTATFFCRNLFDEAYMDRIPFQILDGHSSCGHPICSADTVRYTRPCCAAYITLLEWRAWSHKCCSQRSHPFPKGSLTSWDLRWNWAGKSPIFTLVIGQSPTTGVGRVPLTSPLCVILVI